MRDDRGETRNRRIPVSRRQIRWRWLIAEVQEQRRTLDKVVMIARWKRTSGTSGCNLSILDEQARARKASRMPDDPWLSPQLRERGHDATVCTREIVWFEPIASAYEILLARRYLRSRVRRISSIFLCGRCVVEFGIANVRNDNECLFKSIGVLKYRDQFGSCIKIKLSSKIYILKEINLRYIVQFI